jgi:signal transduction histidine kinase
VFARFYRSPGSEPDTGGMGLGLWIAKSVVERHGGTIEARRLPGSGTRFSVTLPVGGAA